MKETLESRGKALEDAFFRDQEQKLFKKLNEQAEKKGKLHALAEVSGIQDENLLTQLVEMGLTSTTLAAFSLIPIIEVAWADGTLDTKEREAILTAVTEVGLQKGSVGYELVESWTQRKPDSKLLDTWRIYTRQILQTLKPAVITQMRVTLLGRAQSVAKASGGILGLGQKVSRDEEKVLAEIEHALQVV